MPNWCFQNFEVAGKSSDLEKFAETTRQVKDGNEFFGLNHLFPIPEELANTVSGWSNNEEEQAELEKQYEANKEKYGYKDWYDWANANWSTKWGACDFEWHEINILPNSNFITGRFESAWGPALGLIKNISGQFPNLIFSIVFTEESNAFVGCSVFHAGEIIKEAYENLDMPQDVVDSYTNDDERVWEVYQNWEAKCLQEYETARDEATNELLGKLLTV
jgi:hypothetical protein